VVKFTPLPLYPREGTLVPSEQESEWGPEAVWTLWKIKSLSPPGFEKNGSSELEDMFCVVFELHLTDC